ncbi:hypothetical protein ANN_02065 [Periplaneta americana]|uniref:Uncharacterized protein n=1 Tax=Periplaneta americana TaxID=6978 RepID=A0ABQ8TWV5_PERAM|nr:hypothetical protein ANN_02065 [Periplaneta americana]
MADLCEGGNEPPSSLKASQSPDLTACDYFLRGHMKSKVYASRQHTIEELKNNIESIPIAKLERVVTDLHRGLSYGLQQQLIPRDLRLKQLEYDKLRYSCEPTQKSLKSLDQMI